MALYILEAGALRDYSARTDVAAGRPTMWPGWGWVLSLLSGIGWLAVLPCGAGLGRRPGTADPGDVEVGGGHEERK